MKFSSGGFLFVWLAVPVALLLCGGAFGEGKPWPLRDHYSFAADAITFRVDPKNAEWNAVTAGGVDLVGLAHTEIELADGRVLRLSENTWVTEGRDKFRDGFGEGTRYRSEFKPVDGLHVEYHVNGYSGHAFMTVMVIVRNTNPEPLGLKAIRLGVIEEGQILTGDPEALVSNQAARRGAYLVPARDNGISLAKLRSPDGTGVLGIGLLQSGFMKSTVKFKEGPGGWGGVVESVYDPPIMIAGQRTAQSDALWVMSTGPNMNPLKESHGWAEGFIMPRMSPKRYPNAWVTVPEGSTASDLLTAAGAADINTVNHALVPGGWDEENSGMPLSRLADAIQRKQMVPGLTVDPLAAPRSSRGLTIPGPEGKHWVDLRIPEARDYGVSNLRQLVKWKYQFFTVDESDISDNVLREMNITRSVADLVAFEMMESAAGELPVMPTSQLVLGNDERGWSRVAETTRGNEKFQVLAGPTRLDLNGVDLLSKGVVDSITQSHTPIEIVGAPSKSVRQQLELAIPKVVVADE